MDEDKNKVAVDFLKEAYDSLAWEMSADNLYKTSGTVDFGETALALLVEKYRSRLRIADMALLSASAYSASFAGMKLFSEAHPESRHATEIGSIIHVFVEEMARWFNEYDLDDDLPDEAQRETDISHAEGPAYPPDPPPTQEQIDRAARDQAQKDDAADALHNMWKNSQG